jgi:hypothetical protein
MLLAAAFIFITVCPAFSASGFHRSSDPFTIPDTFPVPKGNPLQLFYLQRTANINTIVCDLNLNAKGVPNPEKPINVYWIVYTEGSAKKELNYIQGMNFIMGFLFNIFVDMELTLRRFLALIK